MPIDFEVGIPLNKKEKFIRPSFLCGFPEFDRLDAAVSGAPFVIRPVGLSLSIGCANGVPEYPAAVKRLTELRFWGYEQRQGGCMKKKARDVEKAYSTAEFAAKLRRLADCLEQKKRFAIMVAGERLSVPVDAIFNVEHEREGKNEEIEFQIKWIRK